MFREGFRRRIKDEGIECHLADLLQYRAVIDRLGGGFAPGKGAVSGHQDHGRMGRIKAAFFEGLYDKVSGFQLIIIFYRLRAHKAGAGDRMNAVIRMGGTENRKGLPGLSPGNGEGRMGMGYTAQAGKFPV